MAAPSYDQVTKIKSSTMDAHWQGMLNKHRQQSKESEAMVLDSQNSQRADYVAITKQFDLLEAVLKSKMLKTLETEDLRNHEFKRLALEDYGQFRGLQNMLQDVDYQYTES